MARKKGKESRNAPLTCYTTETHAQKVLDYVLENGNGVTLSTWLLNHVTKSVPLPTTEELVLNHG